MICDPVSEAAQILEGVTGRRRVADGHSIFLLYRNRDLKRIQGIETDTVWSEERGLLFNCFGVDFDHAVFHQHIFEMGNCYGSHNRFLKI